MEQKFKYIVVEDEDLIRSNTIKKVEKLGLPLEFVGESDNGKIAMHLLEEKRPDIVLTDIMMPVMDGLELAEQIQFLYPNMRTVIVSGYSDFELAKKAIRFGVVDYLLKPIDIEELKQVLSKTIGRLRERYDNEKYSDLKAGSGTELSNEQIVDMIESYIGKNYAGEITLGIIAERFGFTSDYLSKVYKKYKKESPIKYLVRLRVENAKELLMDYPNLEVKRIGEMVGYPDPYYFSRVFKQQTGVYPTEYRKEKMDILG